MTTSRRSARPIVTYAIALVLVVVASSAADPEVDRRDRETGSADERHHQPLRLRRASSFVRIGKAAALSSADDYLGETAAGLDGTNEYNNKRASSFVRIGKSSASDEPIDMLSSYENEYNPQKRTSSLVRIGRPNTFSSSQSKSSPFADDFHRKRMSSFVRIGKKRAASTYEYPLSSMIPVVCGTPGTVACPSPLEDGEELAERLAAVPDKKASSFIRIGRRSAAEDPDQQ